MLFPKIKLSEIKLFWVLAFPRRNTSLMQEHWMLVILVNQSCYLRQSKLHFHRKIWSFIIIVDNPIGNVWHISSKTVIHTYTRMMISEIWYLRCIVFGSERYFHEKISVPKFSDTMYNTFSVKTYIYNTINLLVYLIYVYLNFRISIDLIIKTLLRDTE